MNYIKILKHKNFHELFLYLLVMAGGLLFIIRPLLHDGFFPTMDDVQVVRIDEMFKEITRGQFPVRYVNDLGNGGGYMLFSFYPPLVYYIGASIHSLGFSLVQATKLTFIFGYVVGICGMLLLLRRLFSDKVALLGTLIFIATPFLNYEVFIRGALAEFFGFSLVPLGIWSYLKYLSDRSITSFFLVGIVLSTIIITHTFVGFFTLFFLILLSFFLVKDKKEIILVGLAIVFSLFISMWFWLPVFLEQHFTKYSQNFFAVESYKNNFLSPLAVFGVGVPQWDFLPPVVGVGIGIGIIIALMFFLFTRTFRKANLIIPFVVVLVVTLFLISPLSKILWDRVSQLQYMQFPWRFLGFVNVFAIIIISYFISAFKNMFLPLLITAVIIGINLFYYQDYFRPSTYNYISTYYAEDECGTTTWAAEYMPLTAKTCLHRDKNRDLHFPPVLAAKGIEITSFVERENGRVVMLSKTGAEGDVIVRKYSTPNWKATISGKPVVIQPSVPHGLVTIHVPEGDQNVTLTWGKSLIQNLSEVLSIGLSMLILVSFLLMRTFIMRNKQI